MKKKSCHQVHTDKPLYPLIEKQHLLQNQCSDRTGLLCICNPMHNIGHIIYKKKQNKKTNTCFNILTSLLIELDKNELRMNSKVQ